MPQRPFFALLIGINRYASPAVPDLAGCVNDVMVMNALLQSRFGVAAEAITVLTNEAATHATIRAAWRDRLLTPLQAWAAERRAHAKPAEQPAVLIYFSGHGSQALAVNKASGYDETLVPHDSRTDGVYDIKDWELGQWLKELTHYTTNVTVILDSCHSGSGTRLDRKQVTDVRACPRDDRPQPRVDGATAAVRGALDQSQQHGQLAYVLLAACRNDEKAREETLGEPPQRHGVFTYWLLEILRQQPPHQPLTYRDLYDQVRHRLQTVGALAGVLHTQTPQCEGDRDRFFLGDFRSVRSRWLTVVAERDGLIWVDSGQAQGLSTGTILHLYPQAIATDQEPQTQPLAVLQVEVVEAVQSGCIRVDPAPLTPLPPGARAFVHTYGKSRKRIKVALDFEEGMSLNTMRERLLLPDIHPQIELALPHERALFRLVKAAELLQLQGANQQQVYQVYNLRQLNPYRRPLVAKDLDPVVRDLLHLVNQAQVGAIAGDPGAEIVTALRITLACLLTAADTGELQTAPFTTDRDGNTLLPVDVPFVLSITNGYPRPLYITVLELGYQGDVTRVYPQIAGVNEAVAAGKTLQIGHTHDPHSQLLLRLPPGVPTVNETFKIIATTQEANFDYLLQGELPSSRPKAPPITRSGQSQPPAPALRAYQQGSERLPEDQWGSIEVRVKVVREAVH